jgi:GDPmannose 4,6-dehydratase
MRPVAIVTGATGQGGSYLCELLLEKGYHVKCLVRRSTYPIQASNLKPYLGEVSLYEGDVLDQSSIFSVLSDCGHFERIEVYNLAGQSHAGTSYNCPKFTFEVNTLSILNILEINVEYTRHLLQKCLERSKSIHKMNPQFLILKLYTASLK